MDKIGRGLTAQIYKSEKDGVAVVKKVFEPVTLVKFLYCLAFQSSYPYSSNPDALQSAYHRRRIACKLTKAMLGDNNVANAYGIDLNEHALYCEYVNGAHVSSNEHLRGFLNKCEDLFNEAGLPSWQVSKFNPHRERNVLAEKGSVYRVVDFESGVPFPPWKFDEVDFKKLRIFSEKIRSKFPEEAYSELMDDIKKCEFYTSSWKNSEMAVLRRFHKGGESLIESVRNPEYGRRIVENKINASVQRLSENYELDEIRVKELYEFNPEMLKHLSVHLGISVATPSGFFLPVSALVSSTLRFGWTAYHWNKARKNNDEEGEKLHNWKVAMTSLIPILGGVSYLLFDDFDASAVLLNQFYYEKVGRHLPIFKDLPLFRQLIVGRIKKRIQ